MTTLAKKLPAPAAKVAPEKYLVRIHPVAEPHYVTRTFLVHGLGMQFNVDEGWYEIDARYARQLAQFRNNHNDPNSRPIFQIATPEAAKALEERELERAAAATKPRQMIPGTKIQKLAQPKLIEQLKDDEPEAPAAVQPRTLVPVAEGEEDPDADLLTSPEELLEDEPLESGGDLTTADLAVGTAAKPKKPEIVRPDPAELPPARAVAGPTPKKSTKAR